MVIQYGGREYEPAICVLVMDWTEQRVINQKWFSKGSRARRLEDRAGDHIKSMRVWAKDQANDVSIHKIMNADLRALKSARVMVDWI